MKLQNINCEYIRIISPSYAAGYANNSIKSVEVIGSVNDGASVSENVLISTSNKSWTINIAFNSLTKINQLYIKNFVTGLTHPLLSDGIKLAITETNLTMLESLVSQKLQSEFFITGVEQSYVITDGEILTITFSKLPENLFLYSIVTLETASEVPKTKYSHYADGETVIFNGDNLLLSPNFFGDDTFADGIYKITLKVMDYNNVVVREETCYFMDCTIAGSLITNINVEECNEADIRTLMLHYSLRVASNRACDCDEMQNIFDFLEKHIDTTNTDPCGC